MSFWFVTFRFNGYNKLFKLLSNHYRQQLNCHLSYLHSLNLTKNKLLVSKKSIKEWQKFFSSKQESYFSAIGGTSNDYPTDLSPEQVTKILKSNEICAQNIIKSVKSIECNQLGSNNPIEDRIRVSKLNLKPTYSSSQSLNPHSSTSNTLLLGVFDGHGGRLCVDVVARRLFTYIAISLLSNPVDVLKHTSVDSVVQDIYSCPNMSDSIGLTYDKPATKKIKKVIHQLDRELYLKYAEQFQQNSVQNVENILKQAFNRCDQDLSDEIETGLFNPSSNVLLHYYLSLAVSGCCVTIMLIHEDNCYIASTGDCRAVMGFEEISNSTFKSVDLTFDHNSESFSEVKRIYAEHPSNEHKSIIKNNRLLSYLAPLRAFGDYCYKWPVDTIKKSGLTRAFGSQIIPPNYITPPYLIVEPDVTKVSISPDSENSKVTKRIIILATDGLWEQFETSRCAIKQLFRHDLIINSAQIDNTQANLNQFNFESGLTLNEINKKLNRKGLPRSTSFEEFTNDYEMLSIDTNSCTYLLRHSLGNDTSVTDSNINPQVQRIQQHRKLVSFLTLPEHLVRNFRDDISLIVIKFE